MSDFGNLASFNSIASLTDQRNRRKERDRDRRRATFSELAQMIYGDRQAEKQREFTGQQNEADRQARADIAEADREYMDTPFEDGPRTYESDGNVYEYSTPREFQSLLQALTGDQQESLVETRTNAEIELAEKNAELRESLQRMIGDQQLAQIEARANAEVEAAQKVWERRSEDYGDEQSFTSSRTGKTYTWSTLEEFELVKQQIENDNYIEAQKVIAALRDEPEDVGEQIRQAYEFAKQELLWDPQAQAFRDLSELSPEDLRQAFDDAVATAGFTNLNSESVDKAFRLFTAFMDRVSDDEDDPAEADGSDFDTGERPGIRGWFDDVMDSINKFSLRNEPDIPIGGSSDPVQTFDMGSSPWDEVPWDRTAEEDLVLQLREMIGPSADSEGERTAQHAIQLLEQAGPVTTEQWRLIQRLLSGLADEGRQTGPNPFGGM